MPDDARANAALRPHVWPGTPMMDAEEREAVLSVVDARGPFRLGVHDPQGYADRLEPAYRGRLGRAHALAVEPCTAALSIATTALDVGPGDEVLLLGFLWVSGIAAVVRADAIPVLVKVDETPAMDAGDLAVKVTPRSRAVIVVRICGTPCDMDAIGAVAAEHGLVVVKDMAHADGCSLRGRPVGGFGDLAVVSFQHGKTSPPARAA